MTHLKKAHEMTDEEAAAKIQSNTPRYMDFRIFNAPILGFKVLGFGFTSR